MRKQLALFRDKTVAEKRRFSEDQAVTLF